MSQPVEEMRCEAVVDRIEAFIDDELDADESLALQRHLDSCADCSREIEHARRTVTALRDLPELDAPAKVLDRTHAAIDRAAEPQIAVPMTTSRTRWRAAAAAVVMSVAAFIALVNQGPEPRDTEALRAAAELELALATFSDISRRANRMVKAQVIDDGILPVTKRGLARSFRLQSTPQTSLDPVSGPPDLNSEGSS